MPKKADKKTKQQDSQILQAAQKRAIDGATYWRENWRLMEADLRFLMGEQWPEQVRREREAEGRPCLTNNVLPTFIDRVLGDQRQNRPAIKVSAIAPTRVQTAEKPQGEDLKIQSQTGATEYDLAEVFTGLIKNIEYNCDAETAYDLAFQGAVESGIGFLRVRTDYTNDDSFEQEILIEHIENQFSVTIDPHARKTDYSDINWCLIDDLMQKEDFDEQYPGASTDPVGEGVDLDASWFGDETVRVSEYFNRVPVIKEASLLSDGRFILTEELEPILDELAKKGVTVERTRKIKTYDVFWRKITGLDVLEGPIKLASTTIPVRPVLGKVTVIKKKKLYRSIHRASHDAQRMANYWDSAGTESVALAPKAPFTGTEDQIEGYEDDWLNANKKNQAILRYNPQSPNDRGPQRAQTAAIPAAEITLGMNSSDKIKSTMGMFDSSLGAEGPETSGRAIIARQKQGDTGSFAYIDNLSKAIRSIGKLLVEIIPKTMDTEQVVRLKFQDDTEDFVKINEQILDEQTGEYVTINDLNVGKYDVVVTTGPSHATQRMEAADAMIQFAQAVPASAAVIADLIALNMDWPGADVIAERLKKIVPPNVLTQDEREQLAEDMPEPEGPTPEQQLEMSEMGARTAEANAKIATSQADIEQENQKTLQQQLKTQEAQAQLDLITIKAEAGEQAYKEVRDLVAQAIAELQAPLAETQTA